MKAFNELTPAQVERLALLSEELGEAQQAIGKIVRHGYASMHPNHLRGPNNRQHLEQELGDVQFAVELLCVTDLDDDGIERGRCEKIDNVWDHLHHQDEARKRYEERWHL